MATLMDSVVTISFAVADAAAAASEADLPRQWGLPDLTDIIGAVMASTGTIVGLSVTGAPASGDTVKVTPAIANSNQGSGRANCTSLATTITNAAPAASNVVTKDQADCQFSAGQFVSLRYITTTASSYTPVDMVMTLYIATGREDI